MEGYLPFMNTESNHNLETRKYTKMVESQTHSSKTHCSKACNIALCDSNSAPKDLRMNAVEPQVPAQDSGRERLERHWREVAGRVPVPERWGQEELLKDWIDCTPFDALLAPNGAMSARKALVAEGERASSHQGFKFEVVGQIEELPHVGFLGAGFLLVLWYFLS